MNIISPLITLFPIWFHPVNPSLSHVSTCPGLFWSSSLPCRSVGVTLNNSPPCLRPLSTGVTSRWNLGESDRSRRKVNSPGHGAALPRSCGVHTSSSLFILTPLLIRHKSKATHTHTHTGALTHMHSYQLHSLKWTHQVFALLPLDWRWLAAEKNKEIKTTRINEKHVCDYRFPIDHHWPITCLLTGSPDRKIVN